jgi:capsule polysaccharide export protein KpsC/LpsZ
MNAPFNADQVEVAKRVARSLPVGMYLYMKEHPDMTPYRTRRFYKELKKIPNVCLINPARKGFELIKNAAIITTITGSAGWEGALMGKPVISFGQLYYNSLSGIHYSKTPEDLAGLITLAIEKGGCKLEELVAYTAALFEDGAYSDLMTVWEAVADMGQKKEGIRDMAEVLGKKIRRLVK